MRGQKIRIRTALARWRAGRLYLKQGPVLARGQAARHGPREGLTPAGMAIIMTIIIVKGGGMENIQRILPITRVKKELLDLVKEMERDDSAITVTKNGEAVSVMLTPDRYESLLETIEILADSKVVKALAASKKDFEQGRTHPHGEVWAD